MSDDLFEPWPSADATVVKGGSVLTREMIEEAIIKSIDASGRADDAFYRWLASELRRLKIDSL